MIRTKVSHYVTIPLPLKTQAEQRKRELIAEGYKVGRIRKVEGGYEIPFRRVKG